MSFVFLITNEPMPSLSFASANDEVDGSGDEIRAGISPSTKALPFGAKMGAVVNDTPVACQSRDPTEPAGETVNPVSYCQKRFHSRSGFGYGILLYMRKTAHFRPFTAHLGVFEGNFSYVNDKSANLRPGMTEVADFVSFKGSIVQGINLQKDVVLCRKK